MAPYRAFVSSALRFSIFSSAPPLRFPVAPHVQVPVAGVRTDAIPKLVVPAAPKRPPTAYLQFVKEKMPEYTLRSPGLKPTAHVKIIALEWNKLDEAQKKHYQDKFQTELQKYKAEELRWKESLTPAQQDAVYQAKQDAKLERSQRKARKAKKKLNDELQKLGKPKKPRTAFNVFVMERVKPNGPKFRAQSTRLGGRLFSWLGRGSEAGTEKPLNLQQVLIESGQAWRKLSPEEKEPYFIVQAKETERYHKEMDAWKSRMEKEGFGDLVAAPKKHAKKNADTSSSDDEAPTATQSTSKTKTVSKQITKRRSRKTDSEE